MQIRQEAATDLDAIRNVNRVAFGGEFEARLVDRLRSEELVRCSLVATEGGAIIGHILFSDLNVSVDGWRVRAVALAPMAVVPGRQRQGIGSALVRAGLAAVAQQSVEAVFVLGHPDFYPRFGFSAALAARLASPYAGDAFMAIELVPDALRGAGGDVRYPDAFEPD